MLRNTIALLALTLAAGVTASADFSYTNTMKATGGSMAAMAGTAADRTSKYYFKGQKIMTTTGDVSIIIDFGAQTVTTVNTGQKTYTVKKFSEVAAGPGANLDMTVDVKDTGQTKVINGMNATEALITMDMDMEMGRGAPAMKMQMEMHLWISPDVPGSSEVRAFYEKNMANFPWTAMAGGMGNPSVTKAMAQMQQVMAKLKGMPVEEVIKIKSAGGAGAPQVAMPQMPQLTPAQQAQMQAAMSKMSPAQQAQMQAMMGGMGRGGAPAAGGSGSLLEMTGDASGFSSASVPDSVFAIPDGFKQAQ
jgi:hypothetical protein